MLSIESMIFSGRNLFYHTENRLLLHSNGNGGKKEGIFRPKVVGHSSIYCSAQFLNLEEGLALLENEEKVLCKLVRKFSVKYVQVFERLFACVAATAFSRIWVFFLCHIAAAAAAAAADAFHHHRCFCCCC
jgi:hypothetical protein